MTKRRRFTAEFKAKDALEALGGDKTIREMAARHKVHPNQVSTWKRWTVWARCFRTARTTPVETMNPRSTIYTPRSAS